MKEKELRELLKAAEEINEELSNYDMYEHHDARQETIDGLRDKLYNKIIAPLERKI